ncbi:MAG: hypothetical protein KF708_24440 [Pirellulales bacterium]|nr:hypothetical protein [Pirellulales bacterium]
MPAIFTQLCRLSISLLLGTLATSVGATDLPTGQIDDTRPDLRVVEVRLVDAGNAAQNLGPCYRITVRNDSTVAASGFDVSLVAGIDFENAEEIAAESGRLEQLAGGETRSIDVRLPAEVFHLRRGAPSDEGAYRLLLVVVDAGNEIEDSHVHNNRTALDRAEVRPVDWQLISQARGAVSGEAGQSGS